MKFGRLYIVAVIASCLFASAGHAGPLARLYINPGNMTLCQGVKQQFTVYGTDADNNGVDITQPVTWSCNSVAGTINASGLFAAGTTTGLYRDAVKAQVGTIKAVAIVQVVPLTVQGGFMLERSWGCYNPGRITRCGPCVVDSNDNLYVCDLDAWCVQKFDSSGQYVGHYGLGINDFWQLQSVAVGANAVYLGDYSHVYKVDMSDNYIRTFSGFGCVESIASDSSDNLYVFDGEKGILKFNSAGGLVAQWGSLGSGDGQFDVPAYMAVDSSGNVYVSDPLNKRVEKFSSTGSFIKKWTANPCPYNITIDKYGDLWGGGAVGTICKWDLDGNLLATVHLSNVCYTTAIDSTGASYSSNGYSDITKYSPTGQYQFKFGNRIANMMYFPESIALDSEGKIFVSDEVFGTPYDHEAAMFSSNGDLLGRDRSLTGEYLAVDTEGNVESFIDPTAISKTGSVYSVDPDTCQVTGRDSNGNSYDWGSPGTDIGQFDWPHGIAIDSDGLVYIADSGNDRIQVFDAQGNFLEKWDGDFSQPWSIAIGPDGLVYIGENGDRVQIMDRHGKSITKWGSFGNLYTQWGSPRPFPAADGNLYVEENWNQRLDKFVPVSKTVDSLKRLKDGATAAIAGLISTTTYGETGSGFYAEAQDRSNGIKITKKSSIRGRKVSVIGVLATVDGERELQATGISSEVSTVPSPLGLTNKSLGGGDFNFDAETGAGQRGVEDGTGLNNIGLLVKTTGVVTVVGDDFFYIDDGTHAKDSSIFNGIRVICGTIDMPTPGEQVAVTGISTVLKIDDRYYRSIKTRYSLDIAQL